MSAQYQQTPSVSRVYANAIRSLDYADYDSFTPVWSKPDNYEVVRKLGRGKYSEVFEGLQVNNKQPCVIKVLKPVKKRKIKREIKILHDLKGVINVIQLLDCIKDSHTKHCSLIFEYVDCEDFKTLYPRLTDGDMRYYMYQLLKALDFCHSKGIMHRDIKPHNVMIDHNKRQLRVIDWGLAEYYLPHQEYNVRVASRYFKGPELLTNMRQYDYSLDLWSAGCMFAGMIFGLHPLFHGKDNNDQLVRIVKILGSQSLYDYIDKYKLKLDQCVLDALGENHNYPQRPWSRFININNRHLAHSQAIQLLDGLLKIDHHNRLTAKEAMQLPYFDQVRAEEAALNRTTNASKNGIHATASLTVLPNQSPVSNTNSNFQSGTKRKTATSLKSENNTTANAQDANTTSTTSNKRSSRATTAAEKRRKQV